MKRERLKEADPADLTDGELDIAVGAIQEELDAIDDQIAQARGLITQLEARRATLTGRVDSARTEQGNRGRGRGNT